MSDIQLPVFLGLRPTARDAFGQSTLEFLSAFFRQKLIVNNFMHPNHTTVALDTGGGGTPAAPTNLPLRLVPLAIGGSTTYSITLEARTGNPYKGLQTARFVGSTTNGQGAQWTDGAADLSIAADTVFVDPLEVLWCSELGFNTLNQDNLGVSIGLMAPGLATLATNGQLNSTVNNCLGFHIAPGGVLRTVVGESAGVEFGRSKTIKTIVGTTPEQLAFRYRIAGYTGNGYHADSFVEFFVGGRLVDRVNPAAHFGATHAAVTGLAPGVAHMRVSTPISAPIVPYWAYGYGVRDAVWG